MTATGTKKLSRATRRRQLLEVALEIVAKQGADALRLGHLAERAGVSKPVAYEHFGTRAGLLTALYREIDARQVRLLREALKQTACDLWQIARLISTAYIHCYATAGPEWHSISAALRGDGQMNAVHQELLDGYVAIYCDALTPFTALNYDALRLRCVGIVGAAEAISRDMLEGRVDEAMAAASLAAIVVGAVSLGGS